MTLRGKTLFITGASRGIGLAIALRAARDGANVAIAAKTAQAHPKLPGTVYSAASEVESEGGMALPLIMDVRDETSVRTAIESTVAKFGGIDILINNASAINLSSTEDIAIGRFDLLHAVNVRGTFLTTKLCIPHLKRSPQSHVLTLSPPLDLRPEWFGAHLAYTLSKYGMSMCTLGLAQEFKDTNISFNSLWPRTTIATSAVEFMLGGSDLLRRSRKSGIMADAAYYILTREHGSLSGRFLIDEDILRESGIRDFSSYAVEVGGELIHDLFVDPLPSTKRTPGDVDANAQPL